MLNFKISFEAIFNKLLIYWDKTQLWLILYTSFHNAHLAQDMSAYIDGAIMMIVYWVYKATAYG